MMISIEEWRRKLSRGGERRWRGGDEKNKKPFDE